MRILNYIFTSLFLFFIPIQGLVISVGIVIMLDTVTGVYKSVKSKGWKHVSSRKLSNIISKMLLYEICILCLFPIDFYLLNEFAIQWFSIPFIFTKTCAILLIFVELVSIKENIEIAHNIKLWELVKKILNRAKEIKTDIDEIK